MNDEQLLRYSRQILLPQIDIAGQEKLLDSTVLIIGLGGLGSPVALYLAAAGVGHLILVDFDKIDLPNLQRQIIHRTENVGEFKTQSARQQLTSINPEVEISLYNQYLQDENLEKQIQSADVVVDCCDNFATRFAVNAACVQNRIPLVSGAAIGFAGQIAVFLPAQANSPCYRCLYQDNDEEAETCSQTGIISPLVGIIGSVQAVETLKILLDIGQSLCGKLLTFDAFTTGWRKSILRKDLQCPVCAIINKTID